ncbi:major facilitator superfamily domain-containing protein 12-like [Arctopsyche grandis]|uniref:major facilitator superfamily domain-containing protein 12-like n=1 Tax=Arctopsyche grandis TaxID=121162 RepID=UPI00406D801C
MGTRLFVNLSQVFIPLYLHRTLALPGVTLASVPLVMFISSFVTSLVVRSLNRYLGRKAAYTLGGLIAIAGCMWMFFGHGPSYSIYQIYVVVIVFGAGGALMLVTSLGLTADLIGNATNTAAFVYGAMSFSDKLANGLAVVLIQHLAETADSDFYRWAVSFGCGGAATFAILAVLSIRINSMIVSTEEENTNSTQS